jgi:hypothetical protein
MSSVRIAEKQREHLALLCGERSTAGSEGAELLSTN